MDHVVYILGAGFSAPLGMPVITNFIVKLKDLYFSDEKKFSHFRKVFDLINEMAVAKNYFDTDLFNIEEIFSIIEMDAQLRGTRFRKSFRDYIADVIEQYTPPLAPYGTDSGKLPSKWQDHVFGRDKRWHNYGAFAASLHNAIIDSERDESTRTFTCSVNPEPDATYDIVTLNYDCLLELPIDLLNAQFDGPSFTFRNLTDVASTPHVPALAKLHGSVADKTIVPPTWKKSVTKSIEDHWKTAREALARANHIRFLGYSLPVSDAYVKFLLKAAIIDSPHLKRIDVVTFDSDGETERRYRDFVTFSYFRFRSGDISEYLAATRAHAYTKARHQYAMGKGPKKTRIKYSGLEKAHETFMSKE